MSDTVISVENLSKSYLIGHDGPQERYHSLRDTLVRHSRNYARKALDMARGRQIIQGDTVEEFWALKDVSFEVKRGEVLGIIGRNGAGKSTLLKILSRITEPTSGRVTLDGRVASLLEVGTGFHPELTGRENIFLNGAILGMTKAEIKKKFDEIVEFAGVEKFLDTPVKRYSSGMYVRLAFAVAAHLEPEILIIDEVLAVGDAEFQAKCLGKMQDVANGGRTVLFVSHNMAAVTRLCSRAILMHAGGIILNDLTSRAVIAYNSATVQTAKRNTEFAASPHVCGVRLDAIELHRGNLVVSVDYASPWKLNPVKVGVVIRNQRGQPLLGIGTEMAADFLPPAEASGTVVLTIEDLPLHSGLYKISIWLGEKNENHDVVEDILIFQFNAASSLPPGVSTDVAGDVRADGRWNWLPKVTAAE